MAEDLDIRREQVRSVLKQAGVEIETAISRLDSMEPYELAEVRGASGGLVGFFDTNGTCQKTQSFDPLAFFDTNGTCSSADLRRFNPLAFFDTNGSCAAMQMPERGAARKAS